MTTDAKPPSPAPAPAPTKPQRSAFGPALAGLIVPIGAFVLSWIYVGKIPMAVPKTEWGHWMVMGALLGMGGIVGFVFGIRALMRGGFRSLAVAGVLVSLVVLLIAWAGLFA